MAQKLYKSFDKSFLLERHDLESQFRNIRTYSETLCEELVVEDYVVQAMEDVSPPKWHLAHTSWFFEELVCSRFLEDYQKFNQNFGRLFNSYYQSYGEPFPRERRGSLSRPSVREVYRYRQYVSAAVMVLIDEARDDQWHEIKLLIELGLQHEQQHQELLLSDIKYNFYSNPLKPSYFSGVFVNPRDFQHPTENVGWETYAEGLREIGFAGEGFAFDNEKPRHREFIPAFKISRRCVTNREYLEFIEDGGYETAALWLAEGWAQIEKQKWDAPLYWEKEQGLWTVFSLSGVRTVDLGAIACHLSFYEADAFARWSKKRLPTEFEWEVAADTIGVSKPSVWQWTTSAYAAYPGFRAYSGMLEEYNAKFMSGQMVLRGGSWATPPNHLRVTYRNFFPPNSRWQFTGVRLVDDV